MNDQFNADEVFEIAEQIERNGAAFYRKAAEATDLPSAKRLLTQLAEMEDRHEHTFAGMREDLHRKHPDWLPKFFDAEGESETAQYMQAMARDLIFKPATAPAELPSRRLERILEVAIGREKDSIVYYLGMKDTVPADLGRDQIDRIIREEMTHITILSRELAAHQND